MTTTIPVLLLPFQAIVYDNVIPDEYPSYIFDALQHPDRIWKKPFERLDMKCRNLLVCLFFCNEYGERIDVLRVNFYDVNHLLCQHYSHPSKPDDFETALRSLESGFITISGQQVNFVNPSIRDFLKDHLLKDIEFLQLLPAGVKRADWTKRLWDYVWFNFNGSDIPGKLARKFIGLTSIVSEASSDDICLTERLELLLSWGEFSGEDIFFQCASKLSQSNTLKPGPRRNGERIIEFYSTLDDEGYYSIIDDISKQNIKDGCMNNLMELLEEDMGIRELIGIIKSVDKNLSNSISVELEDNLYWASDYHFRQTEDAIMDMDSEWELYQYSEHLDELAKLTNRDNSSIKRAKKTIAEKISEIENAYEDENNPDFPTNNSSSEKDDFNDDDLLSLFSTLT